MSATKTPSPEEVERARETCQGALDNFAVECAELGMYDNMLPFRVCLWALDRVATLERERDEGMRRGILYAAEAFESDAVRVPNGTAFHGGGLHGASIYNVNMRTARKLRELADAAPWEETTDG